MTAKILEEVIQLAERWPESAQRELAGLAEEIDAELGAKTYIATPEELAGIRRGLADISAGRVATPDQVADLFKKYRPA